MIMFDEDDDDVRELETQATWSTSAAQLASPTQEPMATTACTCWSAGHAGDDDITLLGSKPGGAGDGLF